VDFPQSMLALVQQTLALQGRIGATRIYVTPPAVGVLAGTLSDPLSVRFTTPGYVLALYGQEAQQATFASYAQTSVKVEIDGVENLIVDGNGGGPAFQSLAGLVGGVNNWFPIMRRVVQGDLWVFTFQNGSAGPITPGMSLAFLADADLARMAQSQNARG
jgi:hypothetical protein